MSNETPMPQSNDHTAVMQQQVHALINLSEDDLYRTLGMQMKQAELAQQHNPAALEEAQAKGAFDESEGAEMGLGDNLRAFGARWWSEIEPKLYIMLCSAESPERDQVLASIPVAKGGAAAIAGSSSGSVSADTIALALAPLLIGLLPFNLPIIASVAASIAAKMIISSGLKTTCDMWAESIDEREKQKAKDAPPKGSAAATS